MFKIKTSVLFLSLAFATVVHAADNDAVVTLGEVKVNSAANGPLALKSVLTSVNVLGGDRIQQENVSGTWQLFNQMPGVMLTEFRQGTTSGKFSMRGFNGEGTVNAVKLLIDGIPSNSNDGNMPYLDMVFPLDIEAIELVKGTNDPRYGLHNIAGNANLVTTIGGNDTQARLRVGSFNTTEIQLAKGLDNGSFSQNYFVAHQATDTYRDHGESGKTALAGKWFFTPDASTRFGVIARLFKHEADEPGYLRQSVARSSPESSGAHSAFDEGKRELAQLSAHFDRSLSDTVFWSTKAYLNHIDDQRFVRFSDDTAVNRQQERFVQETHTGAMTSLTWRATEQLALEGGLDAQWQKNESRRYRTQEQVRLGQTRNQAFDFDIYGAYVQAVIKATDRLRIIPAYRVDQVYGSMRSENVTGSFTNGQFSNFDVFDYGLISQPKLSAMFDLTRSLSLYGNWGRSFQVAVGAGSYQSATQRTDLQVSINDGWEFGLKWKDAGRLEGRIATWEQTASNEFGRKLNDPANSSENIGKTRRQGVDLEARLKASDSVGLWAGYSWQKAKILEADTASLATLGKEVDHVPHHLLGLGVDYQATQALRLSLWGNAQSAYYVERQNTQGQFGSYALFNVSANYQYSKEVAFQLQVRNLADRYYEYVWYDSSISPNTQHGPGEGRAIYGAVNLKF